MPIDYLAESEKYRPANIQTLLVGEAPPPNGISYIYLPENLRNTQNVRNDRSLPSTIFHHYFGRRPADTIEYRDFLLRLIDLGVFLVDIFDIPIMVRNNPEGLARIVEAIPMLQAKLRGRGILVDEERMIFLLARNNYKRKIREAFPNAILEAISKKSFGPNSLLVPRFPAMRDGPSILVPLWILNTRNTQVFLRFKAHKKIGSDGSSDFA